MKISKKKNFGRFLVFPGCIIKSKNDMKLILKLICLKLAVKVCCASSWIGYVREELPILLADRFYNWLTGKLPEE